MDKDEITPKVDPVIPAQPDVGAKPGAITGEVVPLTELEEVRQTLARVQELEKQLARKTGQTESERRRFQSEADKHRRRAEMAERATQQAMAQLDPEQRQAMEAAMYREQVKEQPQVARQEPREAFGPLFEDAGVDPDDPSIDYDYIALAPDQREGVRRLNRAIAQLQQKSTPVQPKPEAVSVPEVKSKPDAPPVEVLRPSGGGAPGRWTTEKIRGLTPKQKIEHHDEIMRAFEAGEIEEE